MFKDFYMEHFSLPEIGGLVKEPIPNGILHNFERITTEIFNEQFTASMEVAQIIIDSIKAAPSGRKFKLGLTTGLTPITLYKILREKFDSGEISFRNVEIFTIDEYYPILPGDAQSRNSRLHSELLDHIDVLEENVHIPDCSLPQDKISAHLREFDSMARGLDLLVIGIGDGGQVGFNEAGALPQSRTRTVLLPYKSRHRQAKNYNGDINNAPKMAVTMGISTMMSASRILLMAFGESKASSVFATVEGPVDASCPASYFQNHENVSMYVDDTAATLLSRKEAPWLIGSCEWTPKLRRKAVAWLSQKVGKPVLKITNSDYLENSLGELIDLYGPFDQINIEVFNEIQHTITGWPGGKPNADDSTRPVPASPYPKKILIFSPHPDDDVISMGGTFIRLVHQGHDVHVAYETSGDLAVHDDVVLQHIDAAAELGYGNRMDEIRKLIASKVPGEAEPAELLALKAAIRRSEAKGAVRSFGLNDETNVHFLNLPFYESGGVKKFPRTQVDVDIIKDLMMTIQPDQIYMAGDLADPHGTHRVCTEAALEALSQIREEGAVWVDKCQVWLYRGAWMEWELGRVDMAVPLSPNEVVEKRYAIYHHLSQKDIVPFPGDDPREFWQRAEERTQNTAKLFDSLGMPEYQAIEVFAKLY